MFKQCKQFHCLLKSFKLQYVSRQGVTVTVSQKQLYLNVTIFSHKTRENFCELCAESYVGLICYFWKVEADCTFSFTMLNLEDGQIPKEPLYILAVFVVLMTEREDCSCFKLF